MTPSFRRWLRRFGPPLTVWFHPTFRSPVPPVHLVPGMSPRRAVDALTWAIDEGIVSGDEVWEAPEVSWSDVARVHDNDYLESLDQRATVADILRVSPHVVSVRQVLESWRRATGATLQAAFRVLEHGGRAVNLSGGFHHASTARGSGFCAFNDIAVAVAAVRERGEDGPVVIIDLDAHPPDGIVDMLAQDPAVQVLSLSCESSWTVPSGGQVAVVDLRVPRGSGSRAYLNQVEALVAQIKPEPVLAFYLAGADPLRGDALGELEVSLDGLRQRDRMVLRALGRTPTVCVAGGGYHQDSWRILAGTVAESARIRRPVRRRYDPVYRRALDVSRRLDSSMLTGDEDALISEEELLASLGAPGHHREPRFLGFYTRHGLERALESYGYLAVLRQMGFEDLRVTVVTGAAGDRMRVSTMVNGGLEPVVDLTASIRTIESWRTLCVEWLELRDPRIGFSRNRPRLPGQNAPGLGLASETGQLMARAAARLELDGVSLVAAHYHVAWIARHRFTVLDPVERGHLAALQEYFQGVPLLEASQELATRGLATEDGEVVKWSPVEMVAPIDEGLSEFLEGSETRAEQAKLTLSLRLIPRAS